MFEELPFSTAGGAEGRGLTEDEIKSVLGGMAGGVPECPRVQLELVLDCRESVGFRVFTGLLVELEGTRSILFIVSEASES